MTAVAAATPDRIAALQGQPDFDVSWSRQVEVADPERGSLTWHVLDNGAEPVNGTLLCVHGNPTWSYLWRRFIAAAAQGWRVVAPDQLGMGYSERTKARPLATRVADLGRLTEALAITGPVVVAAHDWGGLISLGWALEHRDQLRGLILTNTGVALPDGSGLPRLLQIARNPALRKLLCETTSAFVRGATALSRPSLPPAVVRALALPYGSSDQRRAVADFVADIPFEQGHPSRPTMEGISSGLAELADVPTLLMWGPRDPIFSEAFLHDIAKRLPHADVHRYPGASHLVTEDAPRTAADAWTWIGDLDRSEPERPTTEAPLDLLGALRSKAESDELAIVELKDGTRRTTWRQLHRRVEDIASGLSALGVGPGDRVAVLVPPSVELTAVVYACWRLSAVIVVADAGLGLKALGNALRSAAPRFVIGIPAALGVAAVLGVPGRRVSATTMRAPARRLLQVEGSLEDFHGGPTAPEPPVGGEDPEAAVLFTSGATGPPKGVVYRRAQLATQVDLVRRVMGIGPDDRLVVAFAPFALYGPAMGVPVAVPDMDVTKPGTLKAATLGEAVAAVDATVVFAAPAALRNIVYTTDDGLPGHLREALTRVRRVLSAGAPVPVGLLRQVQTLMPDAELHTPYGMTEALPITDVSLTQLEEAGRGNGVCVGRPLSEVTVRIAALDADGAATGDLSETAGVTGEICVSAAHVKDRYDRLWATEQQSSRDPGFHRTGDVGHLDDEGRLWVEGRLVHVITTADGPVTPVGPEQRVQELAPVAAAALVGVGPAGTQQSVVVLTLKSDPSGVPAKSTGVLAAPELAAAVRAVAEVPVAAVLITKQLPTDIRHNSKVDRTALGAWAGKVLAGRSLS